MLENDIRELVALLSVPGGISFFDFQRRFAVLYRRAREENQSEALRICRQMRGPLAEYGLGHRSEENIRLVLSAIASPFSAGEPNVRPVLIAEPQEISLPSGITRKGPGVSREMEPIPLPLDRLVEQAVTFHA
jgi:hypothetical protein